MHTDFFTLGKQHLEAHKHTDALKYFGLAVEQNANLAEYISYYGLSLALARNDLSGSVEKCTYAIKKCVWKAELYLNLCRVYLHFGNRTAALNTLMRGLRYAPASRELFEELARLNFNARRPPIFANLTREHPLNKYFGLFFRRHLPKIPGKGKGGPP